MSIRFILQNNRFINNKSQPIIPKKETDIKVNTQLKKGVVTNNTIESVSNHTPTEKNNKGYEVSILITAYNTQDYIEETLDSILKQKFINKINYEIIVGVDACNKTLQKLESIKHKYKNLKILMMDKNVGSYITRNTLVTEAKYDNLLFFDSDDIMYDNLLYEILKVGGDIEVVRFCYKIFKKNIRYSKPTNCKYGANGVFFIRKGTFNKFGGFLPNRFSCDTEFHKRIKNFVKLKIINEPLFFYRRHDNNLTVTIPIGGDIRIKWDKENIKSNYTIEESYIKPIITTFKEII